MAAGAKVEPAPPSLQRLLALDKSFETLEERIQEAARILNLPGYAKNASPTQDALLADALLAIASPPLHTARHEFVLRWILDKLRTQPDARSSKAAWSLVAHILHCLPTITITKVLPATSLLPTITQTLVELFPAAKEQSPPSANGNIAQEEVETAPVSKKRKRKSAGGQDVSSQAPAVLDQTQAQNVFLDLALVLRLLLQRTEQARSADRRVVYSQSCSLLTLDRPLFAKLLKHWLYALLAFFTPSPTLPPSTLVTLFQIAADMSTLQPSSNRTHSDSFHLLFCSECLWPAALLLARLHHTSANSPGSPPPLQQAVNILERFFAQQLFVPARAAFHAAQDQSSAYALKKVVSARQMSLHERVESLRSQVTFVQKEAESDATNAHLLHAAQDALPCLLDLAIRCTPISTPKRRIAESSWINTAFMAFYNILPDVQHVASGTTNTTLITMLDIMLTSKLSVDAEVLIKLLNDKAALFGPNEGPNAAPDFHLTAKVLEMDANLFTDVKATPCLALFRALSVGGRCKTQAEDDDAARENTRDFLSGKIAVPLLKAFARVRNLKGFLDQWYLQLQSYQKLDGGEWFIWTDQALQTSLADVMEASLDVTQIASTIHSFSTPLLSSSTESVSASVVILNAVIGALRNDTTIATLQTTLESLFKTIQELLDASSQTDALTTASMLTLTSRLLTLWYPVWSISQPQESLQSHGKAQLGSPMNIALKTIETWQNMTNKRSISELAVVTTTAADSAFACITTTCHLLGRLANCQDDVAKLLRKATLSQDGHAGDCYANQRPQAFFAIMSRYPELLSCIPQSDRQTLLKRFLDITCKGNSASYYAFEVVLDAIVSAADTTVKDDLFITLSEALSSNAETKQGVAIRLLMKWSLHGLTRQQRETTLDHLTSSLLQTHTNIENPDARLSFIIDILELPNATAKLATDTAIIWQLAETLSSQETKQSTLDFYEEVSRLLLRHTLDTKDQERSKSFIAMLSGELAGFMKTSKPLQSANKLRLLTAFLDATERRLDETTLAKLPHRSSDVVDSISKRLYTHISAAVDQKATSCAPSIVEAVRFLAAMPPSFQQSGGASSKKYANRFVDILASISTLSVQGTDPITMSVRVESFRRLAFSKSSVTVDDMSNMAQDLLRDDPDPKQHESILRTFSSVIEPIPEQSKLSFAGKLLGTSETIEQLSSGKVGLAMCLIRSSKASTDEERIAATRILAHVLELLRQCRVYNVHRQLVDCLSLILRNKPHMVTQHGVETTIATLVHLASPSSPSLGVDRGRAIFEELCSLTQSLLQFHRASLGGRHHIFDLLIQRLLACLFLPGSRDNGTLNRFKHPRWLDTKQHPLTLKHAQKVSRILENLCNPSQGDISKHRNNKHSHSNDLVDAARKVRTQVGQHVQHILHYFCTLMLHGRMGEGMRDALTPGLWAMIEVIEMGADSTRGVKALSAGMNNAERAVLRGIFEDWRRFGAWRG